tara:strand:- start:320 stop:517 length:198 start_codon:yes stop_codon:yes gene_type:complete
MKVFPEYITRGKYPNISNYIEALYKDYFNNYLTVEKFAADYQISVKLANKLIKKGRTINNERIEK